ncbi:Mur ligase family protein [Roseisolibacter sp. H3M3-2]|uniref:Mur ligase family protein n=1 Tax=Roseisolibacter sp. H3M3-2 TaxID=3031323 RepID=UPI0023DB76F3|nr:Mur ligase family protein [Roseisolibacter sp. H3M3-2]
MARVCADSRHVAAGDLFVGLPGTRRRGADYVADAAARVARALCVEARDADAPTVRDAGLPVLVVDDAHVALARLASALEGYPARSLRMVGVTGTLGKTSTVLLVQAALDAARAGIPHGVGTIGSLGARVRGPAAARVPAVALPDLDGMTTPDAPVLQRALRVMADAGVDLVAMEVTSHALAQRRVEGVTFALGLLTNLVPDEHLEYHPTPEHYLRTKARFFDHLDPGAPIVANADDARVLAMVRDRTARVPRPVVWVSLGDASPGEALVSPDVSVEALRWDAGGSTFALDVRRPLRRVDGGTVDPQTIPVVLPVLGVQQVANAAMAVTLALMAGATASGVTEALADAEPMRRRMEIVRPAAPLVLDDTAGNPETLRAVFASAAAFPRRTLRVAFGVRGTRGPVINQRLAAALGALVAERAADGPVRLVVTASEDTADARNRVADEERDVTLETLRGAGVPFDFEPRLGPALDRLLDGAAPDDVVLLLGAQGMDRAAPLLRERLANAGRG